MGFLFGGPKYDYGQVGAGTINPIVSDLNNFNPWGYMPSMGTAGKQAKQTLLDFAGNKDYTKIMGAGPGLAALNQNYANANRLAERNLASGDAALSDSGILKQQAEQLRNQNNSQQGGDALNFISGLYNRAQDVYQRGLDSRRGVGLQAADQVRNAKQGAGSLYLDSFKPPTGYSGGLFGGILQGAGALAGALTTGATGGASAGLGSLLGARMASPSSQAGSAVGSAANSISGSRMAGAGSQGGWGIQKQPKPYSMNNMGSLWG